jgi:hypothetical protein
MRMNPNDFGKKVGIGVRVAARIAQQRAEEAARSKAQSQDAPRPAVDSPGGAESAQWRPIPPVPTADAGKKIREIGQRSHRFTRAAGRGMGGFLRPFGRVGGILWLEVTGFFFGLFALYFAVDLWRVRLSYAAGPQHQRFLISAALTLVFGYLCVSAFWRAKRK